MAEDSDVTHLLERLEIFEERLGVRLEAVFAQVGVGQDDNRRVWVSGELHARNGTQLKQDIWIEVVLYDSKGRVANVDRCLFLAEKFFGFETFMISVVLSVEPMSKIRLFPKPY